MKIFLYLMLTASESVETQQKGIISIIFPGTKFSAEAESPGIRLDRIVFLKRIYENLPVRTSSVHVCLPNVPYIHLFRTSLIMTMTSHRKRMKFHNGRFQPGVVVVVVVLQRLLHRFEPRSVSARHPRDNISPAPFSVLLACLLACFGALSIQPQIIPNEKKNPLSRVPKKKGESTEVKYSLKAYGIPVELIPLTDTGNIKTTYLKQWMKVRKVLDRNKLKDERIDPDLSVIECPESPDVIFRAGTSMSCHPGNVRFRGILEALTLPSAATIKGTQAELAEEVINEVTRTGGQFLRWDNKGGCWTEIRDQMQIHTKVYLSIRDFKYKTRAKRIQQQTSESYTFMFCQNSQYKSTSKRKRCDEGL